jgi:hypothetical protein
MSKTISIIMSILDEDDCEISSKAILKREIITPSEISDLGLTQVDQQQLISRVQDTFINCQTKGLSAINDGACPECGSHLNSNGKKQSLYHGVYADSHVYMSKLDCSSPSCKWNHNPSVKSHFGDNISPELAKIQSELGATLSFRKAKNSLKLMSGKDRKINNHMRIRRTVISVGEDISKYNLILAHAANKTRVNTQPQAPYYCETYQNISYTYNKELVIGVDGAYIHDASNPGHNFEAMIAKIYNPKNISQVSNKRYVITKKQCVGSAMKDGQTIMKEKVKVAAKIEGIDKYTKVIGLADGAKNCWNVIKSLTPYCAIIICVLDWFHIAKAFTVIKNQLPKYAKGYLDSTHAALWYGEVDQALLCLTNLRLKLKEAGHIEKLDALIEYITNNKKYIISYENFSIEGKPFSSQMAESTVEHLVAERFKKKQKMAWLRESSHEVLQVRCAISSKIFDKYWHDVYRVALQEAA